MSRQVGRYGMPGLEVYIDGDVRMPFVLMYDATGYGKLQLSTMALRNPYAPQSGQHLGLLGIGNCPDDKEGAKRLDSPANFFLINNWASKPETFIEVGLQGDS